MNKNNNKNFYTKKWNKKLRKEKLEDEQNNILLNGLINFKDSGFFEVLLNKTIHRK